MCQTDWNTLMDRHYYGLVKTAPTSGNCSQRVCAVTCVKTCVNSRTAVGIGTHSPLIGIVMTALIGGRQHRRLGAMTWETGGCKEHDDVAGAVCSAVAGCCIINYMCSPHSRT